MSNLIYPTGKTLAGGDISLNKRHRHLKGLACHAPATHALASTPSSPPSHWSFEPEDELDVGDSEEEEEAQAGGWRYFREDAPADVPLLEMKGFQHVRLPDGRIAWLAPPSLVTLAPPSLGEPCPGASIFKAVNCPTAMIPKRRNIDHLTRSDFPSCTV